MSKADKTLRSIVANFKKYTEVRNSCFDIIMDDKDVRKWYVRLRDFSGNHDEFKGGEYLMEVKAPADYPFKPPEFYFYTPNGVYGTNQKVCISIGEYHADQWPAAKGMGGMIIELINGLICWKQLGGGIAIQHTKEAEKQKFAQESRMWNRKFYKDLIRQFDNLESNVMYRKTEALAVSDRTKFLVRRYLALVE